MALMSSGVLGLHPYQSVYGLPPVRLQPIAQQSTANDFFERALEEYKKGDFTKAIADYTKALAINSEYAAAYSNRGILYATTGNGQQSKQDLRTAAQLFRHQGRMTDYEKAMQLLQRL
jgi:Tfp pilus assembly protein PilF